MSRPIRFTADDAQRANSEWGFNCGPGVLCAVLDMTPDELKPRIPWFPEKGYINPTSMLKTLGDMGVGHRKAYRSDWPGDLIKIETPHAIAAVQWAGPWTAPGVPMRVRYRYTHWIGVRNESREVFDINAVSEGGWISLEEWSGSLVPWLLKQHYDKANGQWWPTRVIEIKGADREQDRRSAVAVG